MKLYRIVEKKGWGTPVFVIEKRYFPFMLWGDFAGTFISATDAKNYLINLKLRMEEPRIIEEIESLETLNPQ